ncbi:MAG: CrcB family protein [Acidobacteriota bacterium]|jgi:fluoride exporter
MLQKIVWIGVAGAAGTLARYALGGIVSRWFNHGLPWGTWTVNILGCFLFGLVWTLSVERQILPAEIRIPVLVGFMGAFTTFSTFIFETGQLMRVSEWLASAANFFIQAALGFVFLFLGFMAGKVL